MLKCILQLADGALFLSLLQRLKKLSLQRRQAAQSAIDEETASVAQTNTHAAERLQAIETHFAPLIAEQKRQLQEQLAPHAATRDQAIADATAAYDTVNGPLHAALQERWTALEQTETDEVTDIESSRDLTLELLRLMGDQSPFASNIAISEARDADLRAAHSRKWTGQQEARSTYESSIREATAARDAALRAARDRFHSDTTAIRETFQPEIDRLEKARQAQVSQAQSEATESRDQAKRRRFAVVSSADAAFQTQLKEMAAALSQLRQSRLQAASLADPLS